MKALLFTALILGSLIFVAIATAGPRPCPHVGGY